MLANLPKTIKQLPVQYDYFTTTTEKEFVLTEVVQAPHGGWLTIKWNEFYTRMLNGNVE